MAVAVDFCPETKNLFTTSSHSLRKNKFLFHVASFKYCLGQEIEAPHEIIGDIFFPPLVYAGADGAAAATSAATSAVCTLSCTYTGARSALL